MELTKERNDSFNWYLVSDWDVLSRRCTFNDYVYITCNICVLHLLLSVRKLPIFGNSQKKMRSNVKKICIRKIFDAEICSGKQIFKANELFQIYPEAAVKLGFLNNTENLFE